MIVCRAYQEIMGVPKCCLFSCFKTLPPVTFNVSHYWPYVSQILIQHLLSLLIELCWKRKRPQGPNLVTFHQQFILFYINLYALNSQSFSLNYCGFQQQAFGRLFSFCLCILVCIFYAIDPFIKVIFEFNRRELFEYQGFEKISFKNYAGMQA